MSDTPEEMPSQTSDMLDRAVVIHRIASDWATDSLACGIFWETLHEEYHLVVTARHVVHRHFQPTAVLTVGDAIGTLCGHGVAVFPALDIDIAFVLYRGQGFVPKSLIEYARDLPPISKVTKMVFPIPPRQRLEKPLPPFAAFLVRCEESRYYRYTGDTITPFNGQKAKPKFLANRGWKPGRQIDIPSRRGCSGGMVVDYDTGAWRGMIVSGNIMDKTLSMTEGGIAILVTPSQIQEARKNLNSSIEGVLRRLKVK